MRTEIFLSAGDESGDLHAANLMRAIRELNPHVGFTGIGLRRMRAGGLDLVEPEAEQDGAMWIHNLLRFGRFRRLLARCRRHFRERRPRLVVLVDFGGFNLYLAKAATTLDIPVLYYITPQVWAHGAHRTKKLRKWVSKLAVIYPFEPGFYRARGVDAEYVGHPLFDEIAAHPPDEAIVQGLRQSLGNRLVALFPGSRSQEVVRHVPIMAQACRQLAAQAPDAAFAMVCPPNVHGLARQLVRTSPVPIALPDARPIELASAARLCITKPGTITLEIASQLRPMVIFYKITPFPYFVARGLQDVPFVALVNCLAGRQVCPERLMWRSEPSWVAERALEFLTRPQVYQECEEDLRAIMDGLARPGASARTAQIALDLAN